MASFKHMIRHCTLNLVASVALIGLFSAPASATFHAMQIEQIILGVNGDTSAQAIQLRLREDNQGRMMDASLWAYDAFGFNKTALVDTFPSVVANDGAGSRVLITTPSFANFTQTPLISDFVMNSVPESFLDAGRVTFENFLATLVFWGFAYGGDDYLGPTTGADENDEDEIFGVFPTALPTSGVNAVQFQGPHTAMSTTNDADYIITSGPTVWTNNAGQQFTVVPVTGPTRTWNHTGVGQWLNESNWLEGGPPNSEGHLALFGDLILAPTTVITNDLVTVKELRLDSSFGYAISGLGKIILNADSGDARIDVDRGSHQLQLAVQLINDTDVHVAGGAGLTFNNTMVLGGNRIAKTGAGEMVINGQVIAGGGSITVVSGTISGNGSITSDLIVDGATVAPGNSPGQLSVYGDYQQSAQSTLAIELAGTVVGSQYDQLAVSGAAELAGAIVVDLLDGFQPQLGDTFDLLTAESIVDDGLVLALSDSIGASLTVQIVDVASGGQALQLLAVPEPAAATLVLLSGAILIGWRRKRSCRLARRSRRRMGTARPRCTTQIFDWRLAPMGKQWRAGGISPRERGWACERTIFLQEMSSSLSPTRSSAIRSSLTGANTRGSPGGDRDGQRQVWRIFTETACKVFLLIFLTATPGHAVLFEYVVPPGGPALEPATVDARPDTPGNQLWENMNGNFGSPGANKMFPDTVAGEAVLHQVVGIGNEGGIRRVGGPAADTATLEQEGFNASLRLWLPNESNLGFPLSDFPSSNPFGPYKLNGAGLEVFTNASFGNRVYSMSFNTAGDGDPIVSLSMASSTFDANPSNFMFKVEGGSGQFHTYEMIVQPNTDLTTIYVDGFQAIGPIAVDSTGPDTNGARFGDCCHLTQNVEWALTHFRVESGDLTPIPGPAPPEFAVWNLNDSGSWQSPFHWDVNVVPNSELTSVVFGDVITAPQTVVTNSTVTVNSVRFDSAHTYAIAGLGNVQLDAATGSALLEVAQGSHEFQSVITLQDDMIVDVQPGSELTFRNQLELNGSEMTISSGSRVNLSHAETSVANGSIVNLGTLGAEGISAVNGDLNSGGALDIDIGGGGAAEFDAIQVAGTANLFGTLDVDLVGDFTPSHNESFIVLTAGQLNDGGIALVGPDATLFSLSVLGNQLVLSRILPGDYDGDGVVAAGDYVLWRNTLGSLNDLRADGDRSGIVDPADFAFWKSRFGNVAVGVAHNAGSQHESVPEPTITTLLIAMTAAGAPILRRRK